MEEVNFDVATSNMWFIIIWILYYTQEDTTHEHTAPRVGLVLACKCLMTA